MSEHNVDEDLAYVEEGSNWNWFLFRIVENSILYTSHRNRLRVGCM